MIRLVPALVLAFAVERSETVPTPPARLVVESGRAIVVGAEGLDVRTPSSDEDLTGASHIELSAHSVVRLCWDGRASVLVTGPAALEWAGGSDIELSIEAMASASIEIRRGAARLHFPGDWELALDSGLTWISEAPGRVFELRRDAGGELSLAPPVAPGWPRPPIRIGTGAHVRFGPNQVFEILRGGRSVWLDPRALADPGHFGHPERIRALAVRSKEDFEWPWNRPEPPPEEELLETALAEPDPGPGISIEWSDPPEDSDLPSMPVVPMPSVEEAIEPDPAPTLDVQPGPELDSEPDPEPREALEQPTAPEVEPAPEILAPPIQEQEVEAQPEIEPELDGAASLLNPITTPDADPAGLHFGAPFGVGWVTAGREARGASQLTVPDLARWEQALRARAGTEAVPTGPVGTEEPDEVTGEESGQEYSDVPKPGYEREIGPWGLRWRRVEDREDD